MIACQTNSCAIGRREAHRRNSFKTRLFQYIILGVSPAWVTAVLTHMNKLQTCQSELLKMMLNLPKYFSGKKLYKITNADSLKKQNLLKYEKNVY